MTAEAELEKVWECPDCNTVQDDPEPGYECPKCSNQFMKSEGNGRGHQCPDCNSFSTKIGDKVCPDCKVELEEVERINDDGEWKTQEQYDADHADDAEEEDDEEMGETPNTATEAIVEQEAHDAREGFTPELHEPLPTATSPDVVQVMEALNDEASLYPFTAVQLRRTEQVLLKSKLDYVGAWIDRIREIAAEKEQMPDGYELTGPAVPATDPGLLQAANTAIAEQAIVENPTPKGGETKMTIQDSAEYTVSGTSWKGYVVKVVAEEGNKAEIEVVSLNGKTTGKQVGRKFKVQMSHLTPVTAPVAA